MAFVSASLVRSASAADPGVPRSSQVESGYDACARLAAEHYENFPVASWLLPPRMRPHVAAVYGFARVADDIADEGDRSPEDRRLLLNDWGARLRACVEGEVDAREPDARLFVALGRTIRTCNLPLTLFEDLLSAFRQDTMTTRYDRWTDVLDYCRRSANPIGRLVLRIAGHEDARLDAASDAVCTALQLTNFWQDFERDWYRGRLYLPRDLVAHHGARESDLESGRLTPEWQGALRDAAARTRALFESGRSVCDGVRGRLRYELRLTWLGGTRILDRLERSGYDVFMSRPALGRSDAVRLLWRSLAWNRQGVRP